MYRSPRRRRVTFALLVVAVLVVAAVVVGLRGGSSNPVAAAVKPLRDLVRWVGDTSDAKGENGDLEREAGQLRLSVAGKQRELRLLPGLTRFTALLDRGVLAGTEPVLANVSVHDPQAWATSIGIDRGTTQGIALHQAVIGATDGGAGLVGFVTRVTPASATVTLLPSRDTAVGAKVVGRPEIGTAQGTGVGATPTIDLEFAGNRKLNTGSEVRTSGSSDPEFPSLAPPDIPIGTITEIIGRGSTEQYAHVRPAVDLQTLAFVAVLTKDPQR
ncbi:rod shape-determining protein MreC [Patulibacter sp. NPDC049589]|uniref:rod shape-determining protein MreC n=1 Tax=Patulibacter sp. NPDC049589 TaxID=3154731 RepID=UPI0034375468